MMNIVPPRPDDGSLEPKRYSVDLILNKFLLRLGLPYYLSLSLSLFIYLSIYIYIDYILEN